MSPSSLRALALAVCCAAGVQPAAAQAPDGQARCSATASAAPTDARVPRLIQQARAQHAAFGGQEIDSAGRLVRAGYGEAEFDRNPGDTEPTWRKVQRFWQAFSTTEPGQVRDSQGRWQRTDLLRQAVQGASTARLNSFGGGLRDMGLGALEADALDTSVLRASLVDTPWSAVFVSYLLRNAGFDASDFRFSDAHADYARQALHTANREPDDPTTPGAYRACDLAATAPRPGDLVCNTRARAAFIDTFDTLAQVLRSGRPVPMHCDLVVEVDAIGLQAVTVGGNVLQSVTLRRLDLQAAPSSAAPPLPPLLHRRYSDRAHAADAGFNDQPWVLLMQLR